MQQYEDDALASAGWMYADLLIGLMVVFLATISFVTQGTGAGSGSGDAGSDYAYTQHYSEQFVGSYAADSLSTLEADIAAFKADQDLPADAFVHNFEFIAGYSPQTETVGDAMQRSIKRLDAIRQRSPELLAKASVQMKTTVSIGPGYYVVTANFAAIVTKTKAP